ncbi:Small subunit processome component 20 homolog [Eumeta japonica]|uniref:Small subunit processome component 20 homolog n=1 Tax=Eumeta variegata TaxID=151549 RepID=A0A4C1VG00_EUMVA|nr:Small subunit processome component 20 homolog [Eumeta japonica]
MAWDMPYERFLFVRLGIGMSLDTDTAQAHLTYPARKRPCGMRISASNVKHFQTQLVVLEKRRRGKAAAESFAFVARDIRDKKKFIELVLDYLEKHADQLKDDERHQEILFQVLTQTVSDSLQIVSPNEYNIFWSSVEKYVQEILGDNENGGKGILKNEEDSMNEDEDTQNDSESGKKTFKTLINIMQVLAQFKNPRALHKEPVFWDIYMKFLKNKNPFLQKYALDCVLNYKNKNIIPYKSNLYNLVDDKKFKDELTLFKITEDAQSIRMEHRDEVVPIILRILYGKMISKQGTEKKSGGQTKRAMVMRYLAGCNENELKTFIDMAFSYFQTFMDMSPIDIYQEISGNFNLKAVTSPGKLHSALNLFEGILEIMKRRISNTAKTANINKRDLLILSRVTELVSTPETCDELLGELCRECPEADVVLSDLAPLSDKIDREVDFFDNICHLQTHRRVRALLKFYYQKQLTRILTGILDSFHFDLNVKDIELPKFLTTSIYRKKNNVESNNDRHKKNQSDKCNLEVVMKNGKVEADKISRDVDKAKEIEIEVDNEVTNENEINEKEIQKDSKNYENELIADDTEDAQINPQHGTYILETELKTADEEAEKEEQIDKHTTNTSAFDRVTVVSPSVAKRIIKSLAVVLLPQLNRAIGKMTDHEESHKLNRRRMGLERQEEDMLRVPIALALVKLLQRLPGDLLEHNLPGIIIKLCSFLKSPLKQIRIATRDIVKKVMITVGTNYLGMLLEHLTMLLTRGFQVHVLVATIHTVLDALKANFEKGQVDKNLDYILNVCANDLFGALAEEKEVEKLHYKTPEAKPSKKTYITLLITAQNISQESLIKLIVPFKEVLQKYHSKKIILKVQEALTNISTGLVTNNFLEPESIFVFLHGVASESIPEFILGTPKREITEEQREKMLRAKPDCFIVPEIPKRNRELQAKYVKTSARANAHILIEFSLNILYVILKREKVPKAECQVFIEPLVPILIDSIKSDHAVTVLIRNVRYYKLDAEQLKTLLLYAEEDCQKDDKQANSFSLLKAILEVKLVSPELHEVMEKIAKISILNESARTRNEARLIFITYLTHYTPGKRIDRHIQFFVSQLNYELQHGRESSLSFLMMIIKKMKNSQLSHHAGYLLVTLGATMLNDPAPECRASAADCLEVMLQKMDYQEKNKLYEIVLKFFEDNQPVHIELAAQLCTRFVMVEKEDFEKRLHIILPILTGKLILLSDDITDGRFVKLKLEQDSSKTDEEKQKEKDHSLIQLLNLIVNITTHCPACFANDKYLEFDEIGQHCQILLGYPHLWVRLKSAKVLYQILSNVNSKELDEIMSGRKETERGFIYYDTENALKSLILDLSAQFTADMTKDMAEQITEVIFQIIKLIYPMNLLKMRSSSTTELEDSDGSKVNIRWIMLKLKKAINLEIVRAPSSANIRSTIFTAWLRLITLLNNDDIKHLLDIMLPSIVRELSTTEAPLIAKQLAAKIGKKLRIRLGEIEYGKLVAAAQTKLNVKRSERKKIVLQEKVKNPEKAAKRKLQLKEKKRISKKIRLEAAKGKRPKAKKRKAEEELDIEDKSTIIYKSIVEIGLKRIILDNKIQSKEVVVARATPAHPNSKDQEVVNSLAIKRCATAARDPMTPSAVLSAVLVRPDTLWTRLKCIIINANIANNPVNKIVFCEFFAR